ncbi:MAG: hypothetical protein KTR31_14555 [Myxococcales bacterium]|nr:hypothetical protein [Myxococcales bacterium]
MVPAALSLILVDHLADPLEDRLSDELALAGVSTEWMATDAPGFGQLPLDQQLDLVRDRVEVGQPVAWMVLRGEDPIVAVATLQSQRAIVRVVDVPAGPDGPAEVAMVLREMIDLQGPESRATPSRYDSLEPSAAGLPSWGGQLTVGAVVPTARLAGGPRLGLAGEVGAVHGPWQGGVGVSLQAARRHVRGGPRAVGRVGPVLASVGFDVAALPWVTWIQPRLEGGLSLSLGPWVGEARLAWLPQRDRVRERGVEIYDSGRLEFGIWIGARQIRPTP